MHKENQEDQRNPLLLTSRQGCRKAWGRLRWVYEHLEITNMHSFSRVPLPDKGDCVGRRGRNATGRGWALISGLQKERTFKRRVYVSGLPSILTIRHF